jgi:Putative beta barrel porin-7 (BBP7)
MRTHPFAVLAVFAAAATVGSAQTQPNPLFTPTEGDPFASPFYTAPSTRTLPNGTEVPPAVPEALLGPGKALLRERFWLSSDFFIAAASRTTLPALAVTSPVGTNPTLGQSGTVTLFGGDQLSGVRPGLRADAGVWIGDRLGVDGSFLFVATERVTFNAATEPGGPVLARPFRTVAGESAARIGLYAPDTLTATAATWTIGGDVNLRWNVRRSEFVTVDLFAGYRYLHLWDQVRVSNTDTVPAGLFFGTPNPPLLSTTLTDEFRTINQFHGAQVGLATSARLFDRLSFSTRLGVALGATVSDARLSGSGTLGGVTTANGLLVTNTNAGRYENTEFAVLPTADAKFGYDLTDWLRLSVGYSFLYWSRVERAGDQIDRTRSLTRPVYPSRGTDYWVQGVTLGAEVRY